MVSIILAIVLVVVLVILARTKQDLWSMTMSLEKEEDDKEMFKELYGKECAILAQEREDMLHLLQWGYQEHVSEGLPLEDGIRGQVYLERQEELARKMAMAIKAGRRLGNLALEEKKDEQWASDAHGAALPEEGS